MRKPRTLISFVVAASLASRGLAEVAKLDARIFAGKGSGEASSFLVLLREQADVSGAEHLAGKEEKGRFVY